MKTTYQLESKDVILNALASKFDQKDIDGEFVDIVNDNFWDIILK